MLKNKFINLEVIRKVAHALGDMNQHVAYVGGATVSIYGDDPGADDVRPTKDIDILLHIASFGQLTALQEKLGLKGIHPDPESRIICRFKYDDIKIDVMSTKKVGWASSDFWFEPGFRNLVTFKLDEFTTIQILPVPYFMATKFSAFHDRGKDPRTSKDFEDIVYILDNRLNIVNEIRQAPQDVKNFLMAELKELLKIEMREALSLIHI